MDENAGCRYADKRILDTLDCETIRCFHSRRALYSPRQRPTLFPGWFERAYRATALHFCIMQSVYIT
jgi:hypothetical protein